ncbi:MAG: hypothetical protein WC829_00900 [Hyphomicrobium sp.]|jgi:hypothetical protein
MILGFRLGRRLMAVVAVQDEAVTFHDCRFVSSRRDTLERAMRSYFSKILDQLSPSRICYYAPTTAKTATDRLVSLLEEQAVARSIPVIRTDRSGLLRACGLPPLATRQALKESVRDLWPVLSEGRLDRQLVCAEALVSALVGECDP